MSRIVRTRSAQLDIDGIIDYVAADQPLAADCLADQFEQAFQLLGRESLIGEDMSRLIVGLRRFTVEGYVIYFEPIQLGFE